MPQINATTAMRPGTPLHQCVAMLIHDLHRCRVLGTISSSQIQICPQTPGHLTEQVCESLRAEYPNTAFRLHANARVERQHRLLDASTFKPSNASYYRALADRSARLGASAYTLHAGFRDQCSFQQMLENVARIQDIFGPDCMVGVEGLYPNHHRPQHISSWSEYERVFAAGYPMALDLSHLNICAKTEGVIDHGLVSDMLSSPSICEVHLSDNDGRRDSHRLCIEPAWWLPSLQVAHATTIVFCESNFNRSPQLQ